MGISEEYKDICVSGEVFGCVNLETQLTPLYIAKIPEEPSGGRYKVAINSANGRISLFSTKSDLGVIIGVNQTQEVIDLGGSVFVLASGDKDPSFDTGIPSTTVRFDNIVTTIATQSDDKSVIGGVFTTYQGETANRIIRLNSDGGRDTSFNVGVGFNNTVNTINIQSDGKILIGGAFTTFNRLAINRIIRLNTDGSLDTSFNFGTGFNNIVNTINIQSDGKILVGGDFTTYQGVSANRIIRLNSDGSRDAAFNMGAGFGGTVSVTTIAMQSDDKMLVGGSFTIYQGVSANRIIRLNSDGSIDNDFNIDIGFNNTVSTITLQNDGKILLGGLFTNYQSVAANRIIRLNSDGSRDSEFNLGTGFNSTVSIIRIQNDDKILVGGAFASYQGVVANRIIRLNSDGSIDNDFNIGTGFNSTVSIISIQNDDKILLGGAFTAYQGVSNNYIAKLNSNASRDAPPLSGNGFNSRVNTISIQNDGKVLLGGFFTTYQGETANRIIRLNSDGSIDNDFNIGTGFNSTVSIIRIQNDDKILVGGAFASYQGVVANRIIRLNSDGSINNEFNLGTGFNNTVNTINIQSDGKILVGGLFTTYQGVAANRIIRLNSDGSRDSEFNLGTGFNGAVNTISIQSDDKILVGGDFTTYQGVAANRIIRLNSDGSIDNDFNIGIAFGINASIPVNTINIQSDGKILLGGLFTTYQGVSENRIIRLNSDGSRDNSFNVGVGFNGAVNTISIQSDDKILVGGDFTTYQGVSENRIIRLNSDGSRDNSFNVGVGFNSIVSTINIQSDGKILVGGTFIRYQQDWAGYIIRIAR